MVELSSKLSGKDIEVEELKEKVRQKDALLKQLQKEGGEEKQGLEKDLLELSSKLSGKDIEI